MLKVDEAVKAGIELDRDELWQWALGQVDLSFDDFLMSDDSDGEEEDEEEEAEEDTDDDSEEDEEPQEEDEEEEEAEEDEETSEQEEKNSESDDMQPINLPPPTKAPRKVVCADCRGEVDAGEEVWEFKDPRGKLHYACTPECAENVYLKVHKKK